MCDFLSAPRLGGGGVLPYKSLMGTCGQSGYVFGIFVLNKVSIFITLSLTGYLFLANFLNMV